VRTFRSIVADDAKYFVVHVPVGRYEVSSDGIEGRPIHACDSAAGFTHHQRARGHVPRREAELEEAVEHSGRDVGEVEGRGAGAPDPS